jgi:hypothetical protein
MRIITLRGGDIKVYINNHLFNNVAALGFTINYNRHEIFSIDDNTAVEIIPGPINVNGQIRLYRKKGSGGAEGQGLVAPEHLILKEKYFHLVVVDRSTDTLILEVDKCVVSRQQWNFDSQTLSVGVIEFSGFGVINESETAFSH